MEHCIDSVHVSVQFCVETRYRFRVMDFNISQNDVCVGFHVDNDMMDSELWTSQNADFAEKCHL